MFEAAQMAAALHPDSTEEAVEVVPSGGGCCFDDEPVRRQEPVFERQQQPITTAGAGHLPLAGADVARHARFREALAAQPTLPLGLFDHDPADP